MSMSSSSSSVVPQELPLVALVAAHSGLALTFKNGHDEPTQQPLNFDIQQLWHMEDEGDGFVSLVHYGSGRRLDVASCSVADGANLCLYQSNKQHNQQFRLEEAEPDRGTFFIRARHSNKVLDVSGESQLPGAKIIQWPYNGQNNQKWLTKAAYLSHDNFVSFFQEGPVRVSLRDHRGRLVIVINGRLEAVEPPVTPMHSKSISSIFVVHHCNTEVVDKDNNVTVAFQSVSSGQWLCADAPDTGFKAVVNRDALGSWEKFVVFPSASGMQVSFRSAHGKFLCAEDNGNITADRDNCGPWERFTILRA